MDHGLENTGAVFICYAHADRDAVDEIVGWLQDRGVDVWIDREISAGNIWRAEIGNAVAAAQCVVFFVSPASLASEHCNRELGFALDEDKKIVPVYLEACELPADLKLGFGRVQALHRRVLGQQEFRDALVRAVAGSEPESKGVSVGVGPSARRALTTTVGLVAVAIVALLGFLYLDGREEPTLRVEAIAILPFQDLSSDGSLGWLAFGIPSDLTSRLSNMDDVRIAGRAEVFARHAQGETPAQIAAAFDAGFALSGTVAGAAEGNEDVAVSVELFETHSRSLRWSREIPISERDPRKLVQAVSGQIMNLLGMTGLASETHAHSENPQDPSAYQAWLEYRAVYGPGRIAAQRYWLERTVEHEPSFAPAHISLAAVYMMGAMEPEHGESWRVLHEGSLARAAELGLGNEAFYQIAQFESIRLLENDPAKAEPIGRALTLRGIRSSYPVLLAESGLVDQALYLAEQTVAKYPYFPYGWMWLGYVRARAGDLGLAVESWRRAAALQGGEDALLWRLLGPAYALLGDRVSADAVIAAAEAAGVQRQWAASAAAATRATLASRAGASEEVTVQVQRLMDVEDYLLAGVFLINMGRHEAADQMFSLLDEYPRYIFGNNNVDNWLWLVEPGLRDDPLILERLAAYGKPPEWRTELCHRLSNLPTDHHLYCE